MCGVDATDRVLACASGMLGIDAYEVGELASILEHEDGYPRALAEAEAIRRVFLRRRGRSVDARGEGYLEWVMRQAWVEVVGEETDPDFGKKESETNQH